MKRCDLPQAVWHAVIHQRYFLPLRTHTSDTKFAARYKRIGMDTILAVTTIGFGIAVLAVAMPAMKSDKNTPEPSMRKSDDQGVCGQLGKDEVTVFFCQGVMAAGLPFTDAHRDRWKAQVLKLYNTSDAEWIADDSHFATNKQTRADDLKAKASELQDLKEPDGVPALTKKVSAKLADNRKVVLIGHSYGSVSAMCVAKRLNDKSSAVVPNLLVVTLGGLLVDKLANVQTVHFMMHGDKSMRAFPTQPTSIEVIQLTDSDKSALENGVSQEKHEDGLHFAYFIEPYGTHIERRICKELQSMPYAE